MSAEPQWRLVLCWGAVLTFLTAPLVIFILLLISQEGGWLHFNQHIGEYKWMAAFYQSVTGLVFGLAGLHSFDRFAETRNGGAKRE